MIMDMFYDNFYSSVSVSLTFFIMHCMGHVCWEGAFGRGRKSGRERGAEWGGGGGWSAEVNIMQLYNYMYERFRNVRITLCI